MPARTSGSTPVSADLLGEQLYGLVSDIDALAVGADPARPVRATPGWCVGDVFAHLAIETDRYARELEGTGTWSASTSGITATNRAALVDFHERDPLLLAEAIRVNVGRYVRRLGGVDLDAPGHGLDAGLRLAYRHGAGVLMAELLVHGHDIASTMRRDFVIRCGDAAACVEGVWHVLPAFVNYNRARSLHAGIEVRLRRNQRLTIRFTDGGATVAVDERRPDAIVSADPATFLLLMYGRLPRTRAALRLKVVAWGRRPHLAFRLRDLVDNP